MAVASSACCAQKPLGNTVVVHISVHRRVNNRPIRIRRALIRRQEDPVVSTVDVNVKLLQDITGVISAFSVRGDDVMGKESRGDSRIFFLSTIKRFGGHRGREILESLTSDSLFGFEATKLLKTPSRKV